MEENNVFGLISVATRCPVPLQDVAVEAEINVYTVRLTCTLDYYNDSEEAVETVFKLLVEQSYAVVKLNAEIDGRSIKAEIQDSENARLNYDDSITSGHTAALAEEKSEDLLSVTMGNLPSGSAAKICLCFVGQLSTESDGKVRFSLPAVFKPRYTPAGSSDDPQVSISSCGSEQMETATVTAVNSCKLVVYNAGDVVGVTSPTHELISITADNKINVEVSGQDLKQDLVVLIQHKEKHGPWLTIEDGDRSTNDFMSHPAIMLSFFPEFSSETMNCEFIFLVDQSGSMEGTHMASARETLVLFLKSLPMGSFFNVIGFGTKYEHLFESSRPYEQDNVDRAVEYASNMEASMGETELLPPLKHIFDQGVVSGAYRQIFILTDGAVTNTHECIALVTKNAHHSRCFTVGIGSGASTALVEGLARAGNGTAEFVKEGERMNMQAKVIRSLKCALQPAVTNVSVEFHHDGHSVEVLQGPVNLPPIFSGHKAVVFGILKVTPASRQGLKGRAIFKGIQSGKAFSLPVHYDLSTDPIYTSQTIHQLAAKAIIKEWEHSGVEKHKVVQLSIEAGVLSSHTSFIAVGNCIPTPFQRPMRTWDIEPKAYVSGDSSHEQPVTSSSFGAYFKRSVSYIVEGLFSQKPKNRRVKAIATCTVSDDSPTTPTVPVGLSGTLFDVVRLQLVDGSWSLDDSVPKVLGKKGEELEEACPAECQGTMRMVWATALVLTHLRVKYRSRQEEWELVGMKAERWLQQQAMPSSLTLREVFSAARELVGRPSPVPSPKRGYGVNPFK